MKKIVSILLCLIVALSLVSCSTESMNKIQDTFEIIDLIDNSTESDNSTSVIDNNQDTTLPDDNIHQSEEKNDKLDESGSYTTKDDVARYIYEYNKLPGNFITKNEARKEYGWEGGGLENGLSIGGDVFGNREGLLPEAKGRVYHECDIDTRDASSRGPKRIVYSNDGLIYYTEDHYQTFTLIEIGE